MDDIRPRSLTYETVLEALKAELLAGGLTPGDRLPTVAAMAERMDVSRASVREAYRILQSMGLLDVTQGRGTFVASLPTDGVGVLRQFQLADLQSLAHLFEARLILEPQIAGLAAQRASSAEAHAILATARDQERLQREGRDFVEPDIRFHELLLTAAHNPVVGRMVLAVNELLVESRRQTMLLPGAAEKSVAYHLLIAFAVRDRDAGQARAVMEEHVRDVARDAGASSPDGVRGGRDKAQRPSASRATRRTPVRAGARRDGPGSGEPR